MNTDWVQVVVCLIWGCGFGTAFIVFAEPLARLQGRQARAFGRSEDAASRFTPRMVRAGGIGFIALGLIGPVLGLIFADKM